MSDFQLENFLEALDAWAEMESPSPELRRAVTVWIFTRFEDPYLGMTRVPTFPNLWFGRVPGTEHDGMVIACSLWISELTHSVRCDSFATLSLPI